MSAGPYAVIGAGLMGAATAWQLATRGAEVVLLEREVPAGDQGSSHGSARIYRYAYPDPFYAELLVHAEPLWVQLERESGRQLIDRVGCLDHGPGRDPEALARVLEQVGVEHALYSPAEARDRWPQLVVDTPVLHQPSAGVLDARTTVEAMVELAVAAGAQLHTRWPVTSITRTRSGFTLTGPDGAILEAAHVVVAAGGWLPELLGQLSLPGAFLTGLPEFTVMQENAYHFPYRDPGRPWPTTIHKDAMQVYTLPGGRDAGFAGQKVAEFNGGRPIRSAAAQDGVVDPANRDRVVEYVKRYLPGLVPEPYAETTCLFTNTPDEHFVLDTADGITVVSPCSGHGGKFAPLIGAMAADLATGTGGVPPVFRPGTAALAR
ncbi:N-methyltryptophan oxidase [Kocuria dechangensis]|uniref:N-methyltryptophan oxidase n=1 Tax=Kocuria dechangensis TaxID=1176249 RepID=A0A917LNK0_9MICC|nr:FAD-dependent oxidoreductase [Kocuria dechangensis]GGG45763.1 N-methyltryptophan oxidase [Kocuria dechangensis]